jgi:hypothetical protein
MKKITAILAASVFLVPVSVSWADAVSDGIGSHIDNFTQTLLSAVPENTSQLSVWPDAYIGKFMPSVPPHWGVGLSLSGTLIDTSELSGAINTIISTMATGVSAASSTLDIKLPTLFSIPDRFVMPVYSVNGRLGGFFLPFDIGFFGSYANFQNLKYSDFTGSIDYLSLGADVRYALYEGNAVLPKISLGAGYIFSRQKLGFSVSKSYTGTYDNGTAADTTDDINGTITGASDTSIYVNTNTLYLQLQVSKKMLIFVPYAGGRAILTASTSGYSFNYSSYIQDTTHMISSGSSSKDYSTNGFDFAKLQAQIYAGCGINAPMSQFTLNGCWNPFTNLWSVSLNSVFRM